ncbi:hypothetical protein C7B82_10305 [Stenomitos frigidus ULC18]|uniref:Uncharacterized protein n=2 Tax=Stenomitos TaxID=1844270 RepID=A0A2T1EB41_9CYAN|nr:hypothetical protein C7B82_10305 [Stenomitos frigidus ULC18]
MICRVTVQTSVVWLHCNQIWCVEIFMEPGSPSANPSERSSNWTADFVGIVIAILTLIAPLVVIAHYSSGSAPLPSTNHSLP